MPSRPITFPRPPELPPRSRFPIFATVAPVLGSLGLWAVTRSVFALAFAGLGPLVALASLLDARLHRRRANIRERRRFEADCTAVRSAIEAAHGRERADRAVAHPTADALLAGMQGDSERWRGDLESPLGVRVGSGSTASELRYDAPALSQGRSGPGAPSAEFTKILEELGEQASSLPGAPLVVDVRGGIGFAGPRQLTVAAARAVVAQVSLALSPADFETAGPEGFAWDWMTELPHADRARSRTGVVFRPRVASSSVEVGVRVEAAPTPSALSRELATVIEIDPSGEARFLRGAPSTLIGQTFRVELLARETCIAAARSLAALARDENVAAPGEQLPAIVELGELLGAIPSVSVGLDCVIGRGTDGPVRIDLVADGPHAIVGGTTGSGKSELLLSWMLAMATDRSPRHLTFLFVDFKGGASFGPLSDLPHSVGVISDLDPAESLRALRSLGAELRFREAALAARRQRSIEDGPAPFPRLVVVVDEYAALLESESGLHSIFADIAARGRSLGVHLVLCTQRPAGVVRESILANCGLRISLRVNAGADSAAVIGTDAAARLPARALGRALLSVSAAEPTLVQIARSTEADARRVRNRWRDEPQPRRPWHPPLPAEIPIDFALAATVDDTMALCMVDRPEAQRQYPCSWNPRTQGALLIVGAQGSGKSGALRTLFAAPSSVQRVLVAPQLPHVWDELARAIGAPNESATARILLLDDIDAVLSASSDDYRHALVDLLMRVLREGPARGVFLAMSMQRVSGQLQQIASLCGSRLLLHLPDRQEHIIAGGASAEFTAGLPPGAGHWQGNRVQVFHADVSAGATSALHARELHLDEPRLLGVVTARPAARAQNFGGAGRALLMLEAVAPSSLEPAQVIREFRGTIVGDPDSWQTHWSLLAAVRASADLVFDGCTPADVRTLTRTRQLPPPPATGEPALWVLSPDGVLERASVV